MDPKKKPAVAAGTRPETSAVELFPSSPDDSSRDAVISNATLSESREDDENASSAHPNAPLAPLKDNAAEESSSQEKPASAAPGSNAATPGGKRTSNNVRRLRIERMMSKAELARRANLSVLTVDRVERGYGCRMDTKRKILEALGLTLADRVRVFGDEE